MPPSNCAATNPGTCSQANLSATASPSVTAGLRCAPLIGPTHHTATNTAMPQPNVITIQPEAFPFVFGSTTFATTPLPSSTNSAVPTNSAMYSFMLEQRLFLFGPTLRPPDRLVPASTDRARLIRTHLWLKPPVHLPMMSDRIPVGPNIRRKPRKIGRPKRCRLCNLRPDDRQLHDVSLMLQQPVVH